MALSLTITRNRPCGKPSSIIWLVTASLRDAALFTRLSVSRLAVSKYASFACATLFDNVVSEFDVSRSFSALVFRWSRKLNRFSLFVLLRVASSRAFDSLVSIHSSLWGSGNVQALQQPHESEFLSG